MSLLCGMVMGTLLSHRAALRRVSIRDHFHHQSLPRNERNNTAGSRCRLPRALSPVRSRAPRPSQPSTCSSTTPWDLRSSLRWNGRAAGGSAYLGSFQRSNWRGGEPEISRQRRRISDRHKTQGPRPTRSKATTPAIQLLTLIISALVQIQSFPSNSLSSPVVFRLPDAGHVWCCRSARESVLVLFVGAIEVFKAKACCYRTPGTRM